MGAGEFVESYSNKESKEEFDVVVTCYFLDTANNVFQYLQTIHNLLKPGGLWVNYGPLLYHYADQPNEVSVEFTWEELKHIIVQSGFTMAQERQKNSGYC